MTRLRWSIHEVAGAGITVQFLALVRTLSEVFRLKYFDADRYTVAALEPFATAALFTTVLVAIAVGMFALGRPRAALTIASANIVALFIYKVAFM
jgi:hypothetical protein